jgi:hypothetical protein
MRRIHLLTVFAIVLVFTSVFVSAQDAPKAEIFGGYSFLRNGGETFHGWNGQLTGNYNSWFGITADISGNYKSQSVTIPGVGEIKADMDYYNFLFGPKLTYRTERYEVFTHGLIGASHLKAGGSVSGIGGASGSDTGLGAGFGGGLDYKLNDKFAVRVAQIDGIWSRFGGTWTGNFRYSGGVVIRF